MLLVVNARLPPRLASIAVVLLVVGLVAFAGYRVGSASTGTAIESSLVPKPSDTAPPITLKAQPVDVGFAQDMNDHHDQAVQMSLLVVDRATTQAVRSTALKIAVDQRRENGILLQFLRDRGVTQTDPRRTVMGWMNESLPHDQMPGLATSQQIVALTNAQGADVDRMFVDLMIAHHQGGVHMARFAAEYAESQGLRDLAARMVVAQEGELNDLGQLRAGF